MAFFLVAAVLVRPAAGARVDFANCLSDTYVNNKNPVLLQWVPAYVDASFDSQNANHTLRVTMYGNVTGARTAAPLPPWDSPDWEDRNKTDGKILALPEPSAEKPKLTTLHSQIDFLSYEPWNADADFCNGSLTNASCPLAPVFNKTPMYVAEAGHLRSLGAPTIDPSVLTCPPASSRMTFRP